MKHTVSIVVRAAGERTANACLSIARRQVRNGQVDVVVERPFGRALAVSIAKAVQRGARWSILIDADVLLRSGAVDEMVREMEAATGGFMVNFMVIDRGFGGPSHCGVHGYSTAMLARAQSLLEKVAADQRPETRLREEMAQRGIESRQSATVVGIHDYEQFYRDLYRKMFVRAFKFASMVPYMYERYRRHYMSSNEDKLMLWGLIEGLQGRLRRARAELDTNAYRLRSQAILRMLSIRERHANCAVDITQLPDTILANFSPDAMYLANAKWLAPHGYRLCSGR